MTFALSVLVVVHIALFVATAVTRRMVDADLARAEELAQRTDAALARIEARLRAVRREQARTVSVEDAAIWRWFS